MARKKKTSSNLSAIGNISNSNRKRNWSFTHNNYEKQTINDYIEYFKKIKATYIFQEETGESGTPHLQGNFYCPNQVEFDTLVNKFPKAF